MKQNFDIDTTVKEIRPEKIHRKKQDKARRGDRGLRIPKNTPYKRNRGSDIYVEIGEEDAEDTNQALDYTEPNTDE